MLIALSSNIHGNGAWAIVGNHDWAMWDASDRMNATAEQAIVWTRGRINTAQRDFLRNLPVTIEDGNRLFVHANAWAPRDWGYVLEPQDAARSLQATPAAITFCGHVHVPTLYHLTAAGKIGEFIPTAGTGIPLVSRWRWLAVIGSIGQPRDRDPAACYALFDEERETLTYVRVAYDVETAARKIREAGLPAILADRLAHGY